MLTEPLGPCPHGGGRLQWRLHWNEVQREGTNACQRDVAKVTRTEYALLLTCIAVQ